MIEPLFDVQITKYLSLFGVAESQNFRALDFNHVLPLLVAPLDVLINHDARSTVTVREHLSGKIRLRVETFGPDRFTAPACRIHTDDDTRIPGLSDLVCEEVPEPLRCMRCGEDAAFNADPAGPLCALCVLIDYDEQSGQEPLSDADLAATLAQLEAGSICCICMEPLEGGPGFLRMCATCGTMPAEPPTTAEGEDHA
ncbi:MAG: hypothetical protein H0X69_15805 [Gemmatimonadales bacterium]|nr:hypothetical protein [Gemmatimonadales bacterium]